MNLVQFKRKIVNGTPPVALSPGEPVTIINQVGRVDFYIGDSAGTPILINPAPTPVGGYEFDYEFSDVDVTTVNPGPQELRINGNQQVGGTTTEMSVNALTRGGTDLDNFFTNIAREGDYFGIFETGGAGGAGGETFYVLITGPIVRNDDGGGNTDDIWFTVPCSVIYYGGNDVDDGRRVSLFFIADPIRPADQVSVDGHGGTLNEWEFIDPALTDVQAVLDDLDAKLAALRLQIAAASRN